MAFYDDLLKATEGERNTLLSLPLITQGASGHISLQTYVAFLTEAYHHVKHTVPLLMACGGRLGEQYEWLRASIGEYIEEEMGHQEWVLNDIAACGMDAEVVRNGKPSLATEVMVAYAYDMIHRVNPIGFFGMVLVLEGTSTAVATAAGQNLMKSLRLTPKSFSYLLSHGALDVGHTDFYAGIVNQISNQNDQDCLIHAARNFYQLYGNIFREIEARTMLKETICS
ncbi:MAG: iron-containing redox enzyme family protein [Pseudomonadota bacterium]